MSRTKGRARTITAWAVVCKTGRMSALLFRKMWATARVHHADHWCSHSDDIPAACGPHTVIRLTGEWPPAKHEHRFISDDDGAVHGCRCGARWPGAGKGRK